MLNIKSFLVAVSVSPLFFIPFQLPSQSQISKTYNSKNPPGSASGGATTGTTGTNLSNPAVPIAVVISTAGRNVTATIVAGKVVISVTSIAQARVNGIIPRITARSTSAAEQAVVGVLTSPGLTLMQIARASSLTTTLAPAITALPPAGGNIRIPGGGSIVITTTNLTNTAIGTTTTQQSATTIIVTTADGIKRQVTLPAGTKNRPAAITAAAAILAAGGTPAQALMAANLGGASNNPSAVTKLVLNFSKIFVGFRANLPGTVPIASLPNSATLVASLNLNSLLVTPLNLDKQILIAQASGTEVDVNELNQAILAYNELIDTSTPEDVLALSQNPEFIEIGKILRELRAALVS